jgi:hypothetical protein
MLKLTVAMVAIALAGTASAAGWRSLKVDGSSEDAFAQSLAEFKEELSAPRAYAFGEALKDIWVQGVQAAEAEQREYTAADYYRQVDGLRYGQVVTFTDPTGKTAKRRSREGARMTSPPRAALASSPWPTPPPPIGPTGEQRRGGNYTHPMQ